MSPDVLYLKEKEPLVIPCRVTSPNVTTELVKVCAGDVLFIYQVTEHLLNLMHCAWVQRPALHHDPCSDCVWALVSHFVLLRSIAHVPLSAHHRCFAPVFSIRPHICTRYSVQSCLPVQIIRHIVLILAAIALWRVCPFVCVRLRICVKVCADMFVSVGARVLSEGESRESKSANYLRVNQTRFPAYVFNKLYLFLRVFTGNHCWHCFYLWRQDMGSGVPHWPLASTTSHISPSTSCSRNTGCQLPPTDALNSWTAWWRKQRWLLLAPIDQSRVYSL